MRLRLLLLFLLAATTLSAQGVTQCLINSVWVPCSSAPQPSFAQAAVSAKSSGSVASINAAYGSNTLKGNTLVVVFANGNNNNPTAPITDTLSLTWFKAVQVANSTAFETEIWYAPNTVGGADTVTVTPGGSNASIAMTIYEVQGLVYPAANSSPTGPQAIDQTTSNTGTGATSPTVSLTPIVPNEYVFVGFGLGTAAQTITVVSPYNNDSGQQNPTTPAGLFSFVSASLFKTEIVVTSPSATATSEPWAVAVASFKTISNPIQGSVNEQQIGGIPPSVDSNGRQLVRQYPDTATTSYHASKNVASAASATDISVLPGNATNTVLVYKVIVNCTQTTAGIITLQLIKRSAADTAGTSSSMTVVPDDANYAGGVSAPLVYTANPSLGAAVGNVDTALVGCMATGTASPNDIYIFKPAKPIVLRGTAQQLAVNLNAATVTGGSFNVTYEYAETTTP